MRKFSEIQYRRNACRVRRAVAAFTLIEMLAVISIISILAAMLSPALVNARNMAYKAVCQNNLKNQGYCYRQYAYDYHDWLPPFWLNVKGGDSKYNGAYHCVSLIYGEVTKESAMSANSFLICPSKKVWQNSAIYIDNTMGLIPDWTPGTTKQMKFSYSGLFGCKALKGLFGTTHTPKIRMNRIKYPHRVQLLAEGKKHTVGTPGTAGVAGVPSDTDYSLDNHGSREFDLGTHVLRTDFTIFWETKPEALSNWYGTTDYYQ